jgi:hypothetical protein
MGWTTVYDATSLLAGTDDGSSAQTQHMVVRGRYPSTVFTAAVGTLCRVSLLWGNLSGASATGFLNVWFGQAAVGTGDSQFTGNQVNLLFSGVHTVPCDASLLVTSDPFTLGEPFDNTQDYVIGTWTEDTQTPHLSHYQGASGLGGNQFLWFSSAIDLSGSTNPGNGFNDNINPRGRILAMVEVFVPAPAGTFGIKGLANSEY